MSFLGSIAFGLEAPSVSLGLGYDGSGVAARQFIVLTDFAGLVMLSAVLSGNVKTQETLYGNIRTSPTLYGNTRYITSLIA